MVISFIVERNRPLKFWKPEADHTSEGLEQHFFDNNKKGREERKEKQTTVDNLFFLGVKVEKLHPHPFSYSPINSHVSWT